MSAPAYTQLPLYAALAWPWPPGRPRAAVPNPARAGRAHHALGLGQYAQPTLSDVADLVVDLLHLAHAANLGEAEPLLFAAQQCFVDELDQEARGARP
jgi:hypothetical protein